jgi:mono/diheme cytochrome c family protein
VRRRAALLVPLVALTFALAGCGGGEETQPLPEGMTGTTPAQTGQTSTGETSTGATTGGEAKGDPAAGKQIFMEQGCVSCHTLKAANATGTVGPNLDEKKPAYDLIVERVTNGKSPMPSFKDSLSAQQIQDVATFVFQSTH